ncbi:MAG: RNA polymerase sigma factor [candidate division KSB1 bacterium]|nr:RNA polymerase sigma factor [candidate division KSB1 bacterium]MDZ7275924.1 RNA polymerase sigma factor [candidate division KSB1 bacterium]MDZ7285794.1 RNA polymerase sigma factor [candidate division KSB1 bacterium]MDZ7298826.1 RNA polymerase sigma factor [candidate division KSB1 bacterium]MDZ7308998.1 RNA polymerase sigma factor [candidate division KSB1 bacterium]
MQRANPSPDAHPGRETAALSETELLAGCRAGRPDALAELVKRYQPAVLRICVSLLGSREVDDVVQDIFIKILRRCDRFAGRAALFTWIYEITLNHCRDELRRRKRKRWFSLQALPAAVTDKLTEDEPPLSEQIEAEELQRHLHHEIQQLKPKHRELVVLRDLEGLTYEEIAGISGIDVKLVKSRLYEARQILSRKMKAYAEEASHANK